MPVEPVIPKDLEVRTLNASGNEIGKNLLATGTVIVGDTETNSAMSNNAIKTGSVTAREMVRAPTITALQGISAPSLTLGGQQVLVMTAANDTQTLNAVFGGGETGTYTAKVKSKILDITSDMHLLMLQQL